MQGGVGYQVRYRNRRIEHNQLLEKSFISWLISSSFLEFLLWLEKISFLATVRITPYHIYTNVRHWKISFEYFLIFGLAILIDMREKLLVQRIIRLRSQWLHLPLR